MISGFFDNVVVLISGILDESWVFSGYISTLCLGSLAAYDSNLNTVPPPRTPPPEVVP